MMPWWILVVGSSGRPNLFGPYPTELTAQRVADERHFCDPEFYNLPTRDPARATQILKEKRTALYAQLESNWEKGLVKFQHPDNWTRRLKTVGDQ